MMNQQALQNLFEPLYLEFTNLATLTDKERPLHLAHYTSLEVLEKIIVNNELWFSNPLFMNDHQELKYGVSEAVRLISLLPQDADVIEQVKGIDNLTTITTAFHHALRAFDVNHSFDVYVFCLSEYDFHHHPDGMLSMWRGYGANGQGAALIFNTSFVEIVPGSPLFIGKVAYVSAKERTDYMVKMFRTCIGMLDVLGHTPEIFNAIGAQMFRLSLVHALVAKHPGFAEEKEWRIIYFPDMDVNGLMKGKFWYLRRGNSIEPKLKFPIEPLRLEPRQTWTFDSILDRIVLGPTHASALALNSAKRMMENLGKPEFAKKIWISEIPYRPI